MKKNWIYMFQDRDGLVYEGIYLGQTSDEDEIGTTYVGSGGYNAWNVWRSLPFASSKECPRFTRTTLWRLAIAEWTSDMTEEKYNKALAGVLK